MSHPGMLHPRQPEPPPGIAGRAEPIIFSSFRGLKPFPPDLADIQADRIVFSGQVLGFIKNIDEISHTDLHRDVLEIIEKGLEAADPEKVFPERLRLEGEKLYIMGREHRLAGRVYIIGIGKASGKMMNAIERILGDRIYRGAIIVPKGYRVERKLNKIEILEGEHPIPGKATQRSSERIMEIIEEIGEGDTAVILISGGASALFEIPAEDLGIEDIAEITQELLRSGATIEEINTVRKHLSRTKGGRLGKTLKRRKAHVITLIMSDVVGDPIDIIASGPTAPDPTTYCQAKEILRRRIGRKTSEKIERVIEKGCRGELEETPKPGDLELEGISNIVIISNTDSLREMRRESKARKYNTIILSNTIEGEAREAGKILASIAKAMLRIGEPTKPPAVILAAGETTVRVKGKGVGGRNQELALSAGIKLKNEREAIVASIGSDGIDGNSIAAGGIGDHTLQSEADALGIDLIEYLENNDSYTALSRLKRTIVTGYTGINIGDLILIASRRRE